MKFAFAGCGHPDWLQKGRSMTTETTSRGVTSSDVGLGSETLGSEALGSETMSRDAKAEATAAGTASPTAAPAAKLSPQQQMLHRYGADSLETMTAPQLRDAIDYLLSGSSVSGSAGPGLLPVLNLPAFNPPSLEIAATTEIAAAPSKYEMETSLIELGAALNDINRNFKQLERSFYLAAFGRYDGQTADI